MSVGEVENESEEEKEEHEGDDVHAAEPLVVNKRNDEDGDEAENKDNVDDAEDENEADSGDDEVTRVNVHYDEVIRSKWHLGLIQASEVMHKDRKIQTLEKTHPSTLLNIRSILRSKRKACKACGTTNAEQLKKWEPKVKALMDAGIMRDTSKEPIWAEMVLIQRKREG